MVTKKKWTNGILQDGILKIEVEPGQWVTENKVKVLKKHFVSSPIAQIPIGGYVPRENYSKISIAWLKWIEHMKRTKENKPDYNIKHAYTVEGEQKIYHQQKCHGGKLYYKVDGYSEEDNTIYEFNG